MPSAMESLYDTPTFSLATLNEEFAWIIAAANAEELDQMLQVFHSAIVCISQWCNTLALVACLPGDILLLVFEHALPDRDTHMLRSLSQALLLWHKALNLADRSTWFSEVLRQTCTVPLEVFFDIVEDYTSYAIPNLTAVMIDNIWRCSATTIVQLLLVLELLPNLKDLSLQNSLVSGEMDGNVPFHKVLLSQLTSLTFESSTVAGAIFLAVLKLPSLAKLEAAVNVGHVSTNVHQFMEGVHLATCKMAHLHHEGLQVQSQLLPSLEQVTMPSIPELEVLIDILAEARISAISQMHPWQTGPPIEVVHELVLDWLTNSVVDGIPGDPVWFVDDEITDSNEPDELDELLDEVDELDELLDGVDELDELLDKVDSDSEYHCKYKYPKFNTRILLKLFVLCIFMLLLPHTSMDLLFIWHIRDGVKAGEDGGIIIQMGSFLMHHLSLVQEMLLAQAKMTKNAYLAGCNSGWYDVTTFNNSIPAGWKPSTDSLHHHNFLSNDNMTLILSLWLGVVNTLIDAGWKYGLICSNGMGW
ncbi:hypothetical protein EDC04DRAFT_2603926 [Pisolithus marmoratus]|nr:hypothetical protein EDC04DRAFT_2603926 [Pisolithus marmoratus]